MAKLALPRKHYKIDTETEAALAYNKVVLVLFDSSARLNEEVSNGSK
jgi:hypothetical protein